MGLPPPVLLEQLPDGSFVPLTRERLKIKIKAHASAPPQDLSKL
jgi:hypothetical protein